MANAHGWWRFKIEKTDPEVDQSIELSDADYEHIAELIKQGYTEGEIVRDEDYNETE